MSINLGKEITDAATLAAIKAVIETISVPVKTLLTTQLAQLGVETDIDIRIEVTAVNLETFRKASATRNNNKPPAGSNEETNLTVEILPDVYPLSVKFTPPLQRSLFDDENDIVDEKTGEVRHILISVGQTPRIYSNLKIKMDAKILKKLLKLSEKVGNAYLHAFRECAQLAPETIEKAAARFLDEMWQTSIPDTSVALFNRREFKDLLCKVFHRVTTADDLTDEGGGGK